EFDHWFRRYQGEICDVDVRSSLTAGQWTNVAQWTGASTPNPRHETLDITALAAGASDVEIRWRYYNADFEWTWFIDNVVVSFGAPAGCNMVPCVASGASPPPVPDGDAGTEPVRAQRLTADGSQLLVEWDDQCAAAATKILFGPLDQVSSHVVSDAVCAVATPQIWDPVPQGDLWFVLVGEDGAGIESSWGQGVGGERNGVTASGMCGSTIKDVSGACP
ncbi:MAG: hypothetical protein R3344_11205, partial [Acidobacteriota bacterium]|nr:hypothetical protein [Acidobacteriota bacterium]